tara:strand:- start:269 stop:1150 length:882 start_codon:yes stop_codon:yes gene_type:complete
MPITFTKVNNTSRTIDADGNMSPLLPSTITLTDGTNTVVQDAVYTDDAINWDLTTKLAVNTYELQYGQIKASILNTDSNIGKSLRDDVYMAGSIARRDYSIDTTEGSALVDELEAGWEDFIPDYRRDNKNLVSEFTPMRQPYINNSISYYDMQEPTSELKTYFSLPYNTYLPFHGLKFDKTTSDVVIKAMITPDEMYKHHPDLCKTIDKIIPSVATHFFGIIYNSDGEMSSLVDVYFTVGYDIGSKWCQSIGSALPYTDESLTPKLSYWGSVYNTDIAKMTHVKAYITNYLED